MGKRQVQGALTRKKPLRLVLVLLAHRLLFIIDCVYSTHYASVMNEINVGSVATKETRNRILSFSFSIPPMFMKNTR